jgi:hypothetical protein
MQAYGTVYAYRKKTNPEGNDKFHVFEFEDADISDETWKYGKSTEIFFETRGIGAGEVWFMWRNKIA